MIEAYFVSPLEKIFPDSGSLPVFPGMTVSVGETGCAQILLRGDGPAELRLDGDGLESWLFTQKFIPAGYAYPENRDDFYVDLPGGACPDCLVPVPGQTFAWNGGTEGLWVRVRAREPGENTLVLTLNGGAERTTAELRIRAVPADPPCEKIFVTDWFHCDCLCNYYGFEPFDDRFWTTVASFVKTATNHGVTALLTPTFTPPLDTAVGGERKTVQLIGVELVGGRYSFDFTQLGRWFDMGLENGEEFFEIAHFFTQWGAAHAPKVVARVDGVEKRIFGWETDSAGEEYAAFLRALAPELKRFIAEKGLTEKCVFHVSDEPGVDNIETYAKASALVHELFGEFMIIDALSDFEFYEKGIVTTPVVAENRIESFAGRVKDLIPYYCCGQYNDLMPNRFFAMPSLRNRILGVLLYKYDCSGFLHWGYNFWNTQGSIRSVDPFAEADAGGAFPAGDSYSVYPAPDGTAYSSTRLEVFSQGMSDFYALRAAEKRVGREAVLGLIKDRLGDICFSSYPRDDARFLAFCDEIREVGRG